MTLNLDKIEDLLLSKIFDNTTNDDFAEFIFDLLDKLPYGLTINKIIFNEFFEAIDFKFLYVNQEFTRIFNVTKEVLIGHTFKDLHKDTSKFSKEFVQLGKISKTKGNFSFERYLDELDKWIQFSVSANSKEIFVLSCIDVTENRKLQFTFAEALDNLEEQLASRTTSLQETIDNLRLEIAERQSAEEQLLQTREELQVLLENEKKLLQIKDHFINILTKEFRDPLTVLKTSIELLKVLSEKSQYSEMEQIFERMNLSINQLVDSMENVHLLAEQNIKFDIDFQEIELEPIFRQVIEEIKEFDDNSHNFIFNHPIKQIKIKTDKILLQAILRILLRNACQYSERDTDIIVELEDYENSIILNVQDFGIGIPNHELPMIFEPLFRASNAKTLQGTGVGLSIVKKYSQMLKAEIHVSSQVNQGTKFIISLPKF